MASVSALSMAAAFNHGDVFRSMIIHGNLPAPDQHAVPARRRQLAPTPTHLTSRILYIPSHSETVTHLPVYEFTKDFRDATRDEPVGSSRFKTSFGLMRKPCGDGKGASSVSYLLDFAPAEPLAAASHRRSRRISSLGGLAPMTTTTTTTTSIGGSSSSSLATTATIRRRMLYGADVEVRLSIPPLPPALNPGDEDEAVACMLHPASTTLPTPLRTSFPVPRTVSRSAGATRNPWFTFTVASLLDDERTLQWQMHPVALGRLRYTLVEIPPGPGLAAHTAADEMMPPAHVVREEEEEEEEGQRAEDERGVPFSAAEAEHEGRIRAIYHNVGVGFSLSQPCSEGVLLLQDGLDAELEALILASLLGLLWWVRKEESRPRKMSWPANGGKPAVRRGGVEEGEPVSPGRKGRLFSKILGKR